MQRSLLLIGCLLSGFILFSQDRTTSNIVISGTVYGYSFDPSIKLVNANDKSQIEGSLSGVEISAFDGSSKITSTKLSGNGTFTLTVPIGKMVKIEYGKKDYVTSSFNLDLTSVPDDLKNYGLIFENIEIAINHFVSNKTNDSRPFGKVYYNKSLRALAFDEIVYSDKKKLFGDNKDETPINLMNKSIKKNTQNNLEAVVIQENQVETNNNQTVKINKTNNQSTDQENTNITTTESASNAKIQKLPKFEFSNLTSASIENRADEISKAWEQLEKDKLLAITSEDFALIQAREELLIAAEKELEDAKKYIELQDQEISSQKFKILLLSLLIAVLGVSLFLIIRFAKQKVELNKELAAKNKKIMESIRYALRIQQSVLLPLPEFKKLLPDSFVFYKPLDVVSGDFYWIAEYQQKVVLVVADCTGHGVPGAFMSLIGNTLLNHIVNEKRITNPGKILDELHEGVIYSLRQAESDENNQDGMDVSVCTFDKQSGTIEFAGAMNPVFYVEKGEFKTLEPTLKAVGGIEQRKKLAALKFETVTLKPEKGTTFIMTSDGFMDQFGGLSNEKFNIPNFKSLSIKLNSKSNDEQSREIENTFNNWKGKNHQIDDILVVGFTI